MARLYNIEISQFPPTADKLWVRIKDNGSYDILCFINGEWQELSAAASGGNKTVSTEDVTSLQTQIASVIAELDKVRTTANAANAAATTASSDAAAAAESAESANASAETANKTYSTLAQTVSTLSTNVTKASNDATTAKSDAATAKSKAESVESRLSTLDSYVASLELDAGKVTYTAGNDNLAGYKDVKSALDAIADKVWYVAIKITSFKVSSPAASVNGTYEVGASLAAPTLTWVTSKTPKSTTINGTAVTGTSYTMGSAITASTSVKLIVTESDAAAATASSTLTWTFGKAVYSGMATVPTSYTQAWIKGFTKKIATTAAGSYTMQGSTTGQYWWLIAPTAYSVSFKTALGDGGAEKVAEVADFVNDQGVTVPMTIYRASKVQGSNMTITVK